VRDELERVEIRGEEDAHERAWDVVREAFTEREPVPRPSHWPRVAAVALVLAALGAAAFSPPGRAVLDEIREVVGVERAQPALFSLPAPGRLLVSSDAGLWAVQADGSKRLLGDYREGSWSPFGRFVVAAGDNELAALETDGKVRWTLARPGVRSPRWTGTETDTRIAYVDLSGLRVVAGDGTGDRLLVPRFRGQLAWRPDASFTLALATTREVRAIDTRSGRTLWRQLRAGAPPTEISWSSDGRRLMVVSRRPLTLYDRRGRPQYELGPGAAPVRDASLAPSGRSFVFAQSASGRGSLWVSRILKIRPEASAARRLFSGTGVFDQVGWSPDGRWVIAGWPAADQWLFLRADGGAIRAVANVSEQFRSRTFPRVEGWCCAP
jgi:dipeptidyl aminopeptidase/acylaminoacyl peptidase